MIFNTALYYTAESAIKISIPIPSQTGELYYNGESQSPEWKNFNPKQVSISGEVSGISERTYTAIFSIIDKQTYVWEDGTDEDKYVDWVIGTRMYEWIPSRLPNLLSWNAVTYGANKYVCVADKSDKYIYSSDGLTWTEGTLPVSTTNPSIIYAAGKFIIVTLDNEKNVNNNYSLISLYSTDGVSWQKAYINNQISYSLSTYLSKNNIVYSGDKFVVVTDSFSYASTNGINWSSSSIVTGTNKPSFRQVAYGDGLFVATTGRKTNDIAFSINGTDWVLTNVNWPVTGSSIDTYISYGDGKFIIKSDTNNDEPSYVMYSSNAISWKMVEDNVSIGKSGGLIYEDGQFVDVRYSDTALGSTGTSYFSYNGLDWREIPLPEGVNANCVGYGGNKFMAMDNENYLFAYMETKHLALPTQKGSLTYNGSKQSPIWEEYQTDKMTISGQTSGTDAGTYTATFTPKSGFSWIDGGTGAKDVTWKINYAQVYIPSIDQSHTLVYNGSVQRPWIENYDSSTTSISGEVDATNAGEYEITFTLINKNYEWIDRTTEPKKVRWIIERAVTTISLSSSRVHIDDSSGLTKTVTIQGTNYSDISYTVSSSLKDLIDIKVNGTLIEVSAKKNGGSPYFSDYIWVNASGANYTGASTSFSVAYHVTSLSETTEPELPPVTDVDVEKKSLEYTTWEDIGKVSASGNGPNYWSIGDKKTLVINGTIGDTDFSNISIDAFIVGFDHNLFVETSGEHRIHFEFGKVNDVLVSLTSNNYGKDFSDNLSNVTDFIHSNSTHNATNWGESIIRNRILGADDSWREESFLAILPEELVSAMKPVTKHSPYTYKENSGGISISTDNITTDILSLASATEYFGPSNVTTGAIYDSSKQEQYQYYKAGNSFSHYNYASTDTLVQTWTRSKVNDEIKTASDFVAIDDDEFSIAVESGGEQCKGISPIFFI